MVAFILMLVGVVLIVAGVVFSGELGLISSILVVTFGALVFLFGCTLRVISKLYRKATADEAFVRTGMGKAEVVIDGGALIMPVIHRAVPVSLVTMRLNVVRRGEEALITGDYMWVDVDATFCIKVRPEPRDVLNAARSFGEWAASEATLGLLVMDKLVAALRTVAATKPFAELHTRRDEFAAAVQQIVTQDLQEVGLTLESVTITALRQTPGAAPDQVAAALYCRGVSKGMLGDTQGAIADYTAAIELPGAAPDQVAKALNNRGVSKGMLGDTQGAIADYTAAIELAGAPPDLVARALNDRGVSKGMLGDTQGAIADHTAAIELPGAPPDQVTMACANLGTSHYADGHAAEAKHWFERALQAGTLPDGGEQVKRLLEEMQGGDGARADDAGQA